MKHLRIEIGDGDLARLVLSRPPANALNDEVIEELHAAVDELTASTARLVLLASDQPMFMAGADLDNINNAWDSTAARIVAFQTAVTRIERLPMPTIALLNGHALGAGCELSLACDWRFMVRGKARIGLPEVRRGLIPAGGGTQRMSRLLGRPAALDLCLRGRMLSADEAESIGLITQACDADDLDGLGRALALELLALPKLTLAAIKRCILDGGDQDLANGLEVEQREMTAIAATADAHEGTRSFLEKREPIWVHE
jgi:enoyl-CoA hydratase